jgi:hypothetical protein
MKIDRASYEKLIPKLKSARARKALKYILENGSVSTYELAKMGYGHPPRAAQDLKEAGVALKTTYPRKHPETGNRMGSYVLNAEKPITEDNFSGRGALPKNLEQELYDHYGVSCNLDAYDHGKRSLQADHRIPYAVSGDPEGFDVDDWQILCGSHQRKKSYECENCPNYAEKDVDVCRSCFWAFPEDYTHIATRPVKRLDLTWGEERMHIYDKVEEYATKNGFTVREAVHQLIVRHLE